MTIIETQLLSFPEPLLQFGQGQNSDDPRDGLFLFGPLIDQRKPLSMRIGVVGTLDGIFAYREWVSQISRYIPAANPNDVSG